MNNSMRQAYCFFFDPFGKLGPQVYFANPYYSWEKGCIENINILYRQYLPRDPSLHSVQTTTTSNYSTIITVDQEKRL